MRVLPRIASAALAVAAVAIAAGCAKKLQSLTALANQPPSVALTAAPLSAASAGYALSWSGSDPDGRVDHYLVTDNPHFFGQTSGWARADETSRVLALGGAVPAIVGRSNLPEPTFFAVRAVDDQGAVSEPAIKSFMGTDEAPFVIIYSPIPSHINVAQVGSTVRIQWTGYDASSATPYHLARYRFKLIAESDPDFAAALSDPDSIRREYAPDFAGWDEVPGDSLGHSYTGLPLNANFIFALVGFNDAGVYTPVFSFGNSLLRMHVFYIATGGPVFTVYGDTFRRTYRTGGFFSDTGSVANVDVVGASAHVGWNAQTTAGSSVAAYRWAVDIADLHDEAPRRNAFDVRHWSRWSPAETSAVVSMHRPEPSSSRRFLYTEAISDAGLLSLVITRFDFHPPTFSHPLLIVNDTRRQPEKLVSGQVRPIDTWPNAAELDSFLFARGGAPMQGYPAGTTSSPGIFSRYGFDVYDTSVRPTKDSEPLVNVLSRYRNVVWITDDNAVSSTPLNGGPSRLLVMSGQGGQNTLEAYVLGGGRLWLAGGAAAYAASVNMFNDRSNDVDELVYSSTDGELRVGSFMYDVPRWQSELRSWIRLEFNVHAATAQPPTGGATEVGTPRGGRGRFPAMLELRDAGTDPLPPLRTPADFNPNPTQTDIEYLSLPNSIVGGGRDRRGERDQAMRAQGGREDREHRGPAFSLLDTIYTCNGLPPDAAADYPCMTIYRGTRGAEVVFTGFDLWTWRRSQMVAIVNAIVGDLWHQGPGNADCPRDGHDGDQVAREVVTPRK